MEELLKLIVPAIFLIVWALGQLLNREQPKPPPRPVPRAGGGLPPRPDLAPRRREAGRLPEPTMRWGDLDEPAQPVERPITEPRRVTPESEEIVILGTEIGPPRPTPHRPAARGSSRPRQAPAPRRPKRTPTPTRPESAPEPMKNLSDLGGVTTSIQPLMTPDMPVPVGIATPGGVAPLQVSRASSPAVERLRSSLISPQRVREALILNELLGPPVARRGPRGRR